MTGSDGKTTGAARLGWVAAVAVSLALLAAGQQYVRAASLLLRFGAGDNPTGLAAHKVAQVDEEATTLATPRGPVRARVYRPRGVTDAPAVVLVHGVHRLGVEEPRLRRFARSVAGAGALVYTPEVNELIDYRIEPESIDTIGAAAVELGKIAGRSKVAVMGFSFAGGLSLVTAADPRFASKIALAVSIGGHHDLERVARFFTEHKAPTVDGGTLEMKAHDYGLLVLFYGYTADFFPGADEPIAHEALRLWLANDQGGARKAAEGLSPEGKARIEVIFAEHGDQLAPQVRQVLERHRDKMARVSPRGRLGAVEAGVYLLHGSGDNVIPPSEALWLARDTPPSKLRSVLVSPAIQHVELQGQPSWVEQARVVGFMASLLDEAQQEPRARLDLRPIWLVRRSQTAGRGALPAFKPCYDSLEDAWHESTPGARCCPSKSRGRGPAPG